MHEFILRLRTEVNQKEKYLSVKPAGMVVEAYSFGRKRRKWMEIVSDLCSPKKRAQFAPGMVHRIGQEAWDVLCERWTPQIRERWFQIDRLQEDSQGLKDTARSIFWDEEVERVSGFRLAMGRDKGGTADMIDAWPFSAAARRNYLIVVNSELVSSEADEMQGTTRSTVRGRPVEHALVYVPWENEMGFSQLERDRIKSPNYETHPRFDAPISRSLFRPGSNHSEVGRVR